MRTSSKRTATCAMTAALCVVLMALGAMLELGMYACPLFAGLCLIPIGQKYGIRYHVSVYLVTSVLCLLLVPNPEENLMFVCLLGWYPILRPRLQRLPPIPRLLCKLLIFNGAAIFIEWLVMAVLAPQTVSTPLLWILLALGNVTFLTYDFLFSRLDVLFRKIAGHL